MSKQKRVEFEATIRPDGYLHQLLVEIFEDDILVEKWRVYATPARKTFRSIVQLFVIQEGRLIKRRIEQSAGTIEYGTPKSRDVNPKIRQMIIDLFNRNKVTYEDIESLEL